MSTVQQGTNGPNVIFLITHDVPPVYGCYGNSEVFSPNIDRLASEAVRFDSHYCQWPLCGPSRANIFTGCRPMTTRRFNNQPFFSDFRTRAPEGFASLPEHFAGAGWQSRGAGWIYHDDVDEPSWSEGHFIPPAVDEPLPGWAQGWMSADYLHEWKAPASREILRGRLESLRAEGMTREQFQDRFAFRRARGPAVEAADVPDDAYYDGQVARAACDFLKALPNPPRGSGEAGGGPWFLGAGFVAPHTPFRAPRRYWDLYNRNELTLHPNRAWPEGSDEWMAGDCEPAQYYTTNGYTKPWRPNEEQLRELLHGHYATISYLDALVGSILETAQKRADWSNTVVVFTSDHGFSEGQHGYWGKHNMWDASLHVPLIVSLPDRQAGSCQLITEHVDIYPTLCEYAGLPVPGHCEGRSALELLDAAGGERRTPVKPTAAVKASASPASPGAWKNSALSHRRPMWHDRLQAYEQCNSLRTPRYRYSEYLDNAGDIIGRELFDYEDDPRETWNHADDPAAASARVELADRLRAAVRSNGESL